MDDDYRLDVPASFDDSDDEDGQVHPIARRLFSGATAAEVFEKARRWVSEHDVFLIDVSWNWLHDEPEPFWLSVYFRFEFDEDEDEDEGTPAGA
ncbi:hypothetical protein [Actinoalloteichus spitiensis]|uniref:hypothetical protein n=1 Tax=Actinoalloteichus spitiensis TaxID=252394 RepID=UPI0003722F26|nr:hypothetical protein [Actinoalloteichus spitiensis]